jgi:uncharacterized protein (TIGR02246 family)
LFSAPLARADKPTAREGIAAADKEFVKAFEAGDAGTIANQYTEDAKSFKPQSEPVSGRNAIRKDWEKFFSASQGTKVKVETLEIRESGDLAYELEEVVQKYTNGKVIEGKWVLIWKFTDGNWRIYREFGLEAVPK